MVAPCQPLPRLRDSPANRKMHVIVAAVVTEMEVKWDTQVGRSSTQSDGHSDERGCCENAGWGDAGIGCIETHGSMMESILGVSQHKE